MTPARFRWGMLLVLTGVLILLTQSDTIEEEAFLDLIWWFPVFLIILGVEKIFTRSRMEIVAYVTTVGLVAGGLWIAFEASSGYGAGSYFSKESFSERFDPGALELVAELDVGDAVVTVRDATEAMVYGRFAEFTEKPRIDYKLGDDGVARVTFEQRSGRTWGTFIHVDNDFTDDWTMKFSEMVPLTLDCTADGADLHLNFSTTPMRKAVLDVPDTRVYLKIGDLEPEVQVRLFGRDAEVKLRVPRESGLQIEGSDFAALLEKLGLLEQDPGTFVTQGYDTSSQRIQVELDDRLKSLSIDTY